MYNYSAAGHEMVADHSFWRSVTLSRHPGSPNRLSFRSGALGLIELHKAKTMTVKPPTIIDHKPFGLCGDLDVLLVWVESFEALHCFFVPVAVSIMTIGVHAENSLRQRTL